MRAKTTSSYLLFFSLLFAFHGAYSQFSASSNQTGTVTTSSVPQGTDWSNPTNVQIVDNIFATSLITGSNKPTYNLDAKNWGFQSSNNALSNYIPPGAVINGIEVFIKLRKTNVGKIKDNKIMLLKAGSEVGSNKARGNTLWPTTSTEIKFGGNVDLWGTTWTAADLINSDFGIRISGKNRGSKDAQAEIDHIRISVYFNQSYFYSKSSGNLELTTTWGINTDGTGSSPLSFTNNGQIFFLHNRSTTSLTANFTISGINSKMIIGNGASATVLTIPSNFVLNSVVDIGNGSSLIINNTTNPVIGSIDDNTTVTYGAAANQTVQDATYYNLTLSGPGTKTLQNSSSGFSSVNNVLSIGSGITFNNNGDNVFILGSSTGIINAGIATGAGRYIYSILDVNTNISGSGTYSNLEIECGTTAAARTLTLSNATNITGTFYLTDGNLANGSNLTMASGSAIQLADGTLGSTIASSSGYDVIYDAYTSASPKITSNELTGTIRNFTLQAGSGLAVNLNKHLVLSGNLNLISGTLDPTATNYNITVAGNFTNNASLTFRNNILTLNGSASQTVNASVSQTFYDIVFNNTSGGIQLNTPVTINHALTLTSGVITTSSTNLLTLANAVIITGGSTSSYINGPLRHTLSALSGNRFFPIGKDNAYRPVTLSLTQLSVSSTTYTGEVFSGPPPARTLPSGISSVSSIRYHTISCSNNSNVVTATINLSYGPDDNVTDPVNLRILKSNTTDWGNIGGAGSGVGSGNITSGIFNSFSDFVLGNANLVTLPLTWLSFTSGLKNGKVELRWQTANEINTDHFVMERSSNGNDWISIGTIRSNNQDQNQYSFTDIDPIPTQNFYRIKSLDIDEKISYSKTIRQNGELSTNFKIGVFGDKINIYISHPELIAGNKLNIHIYDMNSRLIQKFQATPAAVIKINLASIKSGAYIVSMETDKINLQKKIVIGN